MSHDALAGFVEETAAGLAVPGAAVGLWAGGRQVHACHGVTSLENPLPVDADTLFVLGSVSKTFAATALVCLAARDQVDLDAPVRRYLPGFALADPQAAAAITVQQLLNHTAGLDWRADGDTGEGDDALAAYVARLATSVPLSAPGARASYSQVGYNVAGRVVEAVTGLTYEAAVTSLLLAPLGLEHSVFTAGEAMTRRFAVGHNLGADGTYAVARQWKDTRANNPGGGLASSVADQLRWARFHLGDGRAPDGTRVLPAEALHRMRRPTVALRDSSLGDAIGTGWFLRDVGGVGTAGHGGSANGQFAELLLVPDRDVAVVSLANAGPDAGLAFNRAVVRWVLEHHAGLVEREPEPLPFDEGRARPVLGRYENDMMAITVATQGAALTVECRIKPEIRASAGTELPPDLPPAEFSLLPGDDGAYLVTGGGLAGQRGRFVRDADGAVVGMDLAGRSFRRVPGPVA